MSLINQMLRDLEKKRPLPNPVKLRSPFTPAKAARLVRLHPASLLALTAFILLLTFLWVHQWHLPSWASIVHPSPPIGSTLQKPLINLPPPAETVSLPTPPPSEKVAPSTLPTPIAWVPTEVSPPPMIKKPTPIEVSDRIDGLYADAMAANNAADDETAIKKLEQLLAIKPEHLEAREALATLLVADGRLEEAEPVLKVGLQQMPDYPAFDNLEAHILAHRQDYKTAVALMSRAQPELAKAPEYYAYLAGLYQHDGQYMMAAELYHELLQLDPSNGIWWVGLGLALESSGKNNAALEAFDRAVKMQGLEPNIAAYAKQQIMKLS